MKEIIRKVIIGVIVAVIAIAVVANVLKGDEPDVQQTTTSANAAINGTDAVAPTENQGGVDVNATTNNGSSVPQPSLSSQDVQNTTGSQVVAPSQSQTQNGNVAQPTTQGNNTVQTTTQSAQPDVNTQQTTSNPFAPQQTTQNVQPVQPANKINAYQQIFASGRFIMKVNDPDLGPVTMAMSGNRMFVDASMEGVTLKMLYDGNKPSEDDPSMGTWYIVVDNLKAYSPMPTDMLGDMNVEELTKDIAKGDGNTVYTKSTEVVNGEQLEVESCVDENGNTTKYYFRGDQLVRTDSVSPSGAVSTTEFQQISGTVDESVFEIPAGYKKIDISWLFNMIG